MRPGCRICANRPRRWRPTSAWTPRERCRQAPGGRPGSGWLPMHAPPRRAWKRSSRPIRKTTRAGSAWRRPGRSSATRRGHGTRWRGARRPIPGRRSCSSSCRRRPPSLASNPSDSATAPGGPTADQMAAAETMSPEQRQEMVRSMVDGLAARLEQQPDDIEGWRMLGRSWAVLGDPAKSAEAYAQVARRLPDDVRAQVDYATALLARAEPGPAAVGRSGRPAPAGPEAGRRQSDRAVPSRQSGRSQRRRRHRDPALAASAGAPATRRAGASAAGAPDRESRTRTAERPRRTAIGREAIPSAGRKPSSATPHASSPVRSLRP